MTSRPRPSLLALFDPLSLASPPHPTCGTHSASSSLDSGSDKENLNTTTPRSRRVDASSYDKICSETVFFRRTYSRSQPAHSESLAVSDSLLGKTFSLDSDADGTNLCLVQLEDELDSACKLANMPNDDFIEKGATPRVPLSEIGIFPTDSIAPTPQHIVHDRRLVNLDTPSTTPRSISKFAAGVAKFDPSTPKPGSPFASLRAARSPSSFAPSTITVSTYRSKLGFNANSCTSPSPSLPFASGSPGLFDSARDSPTSPPFQDPASGLHSASFEIQNSFCMKKLDLSGDLLNDELSFLTRMSDDSFSDYVKGSDRSAGSLPRTPEQKSNEDESSSKDAGLSPMPHVSKAELSETMSSSARPGLPVSVFPTSSISSPLPCESESDSEPEANDDAPGIPVEVRLRTPSSPVSSGNSVHARVLAPKKSLAVLRGKRNSIADDRSKTKFDTGINMSQLAKRDTMRPRASISSEIVPLTRTHSLAIKKKVGMMNTAVAASPVVQCSEDPHVLQRSTSIASVETRPSLSRRASIGIDLASSKSKACDPKSTQGHSRLSTSTSTTLVAPGKTAATTGRIGGARRVPLTADAPLFRAKAPSPAEAPPAKSLSSSRAGQRPPTSVLGLAASMSSGGTVGKGIASSASMSRSVSRTASMPAKVLSKPSAGLPRPVSTGAPLGASSRLPMPQSKVSSRIPGPGARKAF